MNANGHESKRELIRVYSRLEMRAPTGRPRMNANGHESKRNLFVWSSHLFVVLEVRTLGKRVHFAFYSRFRKRVIRYAQRRAPAKRCSTRSTRTLRPSTCSKIACSERQKPVQALAAAQIGQWFSIKR